MPFTYRIDSERGVVYATATGTVTDDDVTKLKADIAADPAFRPGMVELSDLRGIEDLQVSPEGISRFAMMDQQHADDQADFKLALVANEDLVYGMARMYQMSTGPNPQQVSVFRSVEEAEAWLGITAE